MRRAFALVIFFLSACDSRKAVVVGSKNFTESVLLGEIVAQKLERAGCRVQRRLNLGGTLVCDSALAAGALDVYVEYSGTALTAILHQPLLRSRAEVVNAVGAAYRRRKLHWGPALGFNDTFAMIVRRDEPMRTISDLKRVEATAQPGFGYEFASRPDGWPGLLARYNLHFAKSPRTMDLGLTYKALANRQVDLIAGNSTDGLIDSLGLVALEDDLHYFPPYDAAIVHREGMPCASALAALGGTIDDATMRRLNFEVDGKHRPVEDVAKEFLGVRRLAAAF